MPRACGDYIRDTVRDTRALLDALRSVKPRRFTQRGGAVSLTFRFTGVATVVRAVLALANRHRRVIDRGQLTNPTTTAHAAIGCNRALQRATSANPTRTTPVAHFARPPGAASTGTRRQIGAHTVAIATAHSSC